MQTIYVSLIVTKMYIGSGSGVNTTVFSTKQLVDVN